MNFLYWNVRGIGNSDIRIALKKLYMSHKPMLIFIVGPMVNFAQISAWYWLTICVSKYCINNRGPLFTNLWALWGNASLATVIFVSDQCIALEITCFSQLFI